MPLQISDTIISCSPLTRKWKVIEKKRKYYLAIALLSFTSQKEVYIFVRVAYVWAACPFFLSCGMFTFKIVLRMVVVEINKSLHFAALLNNVNMWKEEYEKRIGKERWKIINLSMSVVGVLEAADIVSC